MRRHTRGLRWRGGLVILAALAGLAAMAAGCTSAGSAPPWGAAPRSSAPGTPRSAGPFSGAGGMVTPPPGWSLWGSHAGRKKAAGRTPLVSSQRAGVAGGALFGGNIPLVGEQPKLGRKLAIVRVYYVFGENFIQTDVKQLMAAGSTLLVSLSTRPGGPSYASIASGRYDAYISSFLHSMEQAAVQYHLGALYFCFEVEADAPSTHTGLGTPGQFIQAWDHVHQLAVSAQLDWNQGGRLHWVFILMHHAYITGAANQFWVGANETDIVAADGYNEQRCRNASGSLFVSRGTSMATPASLFTATVNFARSHGNLPVFIAEWGSVPYSSPAVEPGFINQMQQFVASNTTVAAAMYWDSHAPGTACNFTLTSPSAIQALAAMGHSAALAGYVVPAG